LKPFFVRYDVATICRVNRLIQIKERTTYKV
jgi:hypothetical protein